MGKVIGMEGWLKANREIAKKLAESDVYVKLRADVFRDMVEALAKCAAGEPGGKEQAGLVLDKTFKEYT